jgi:hypothetical protein
VVLMHSGWRVEHWGWSRMMGCRRMVRRWWSVMLVMWRRRRRSRRRRSIVMVMWGKGGWGRDPVWWWWHSWYSLTPYLFWIWEYEGQHFGSKHGKLDRKCSLQHKWKIAIKYVLIYWT